MILNCNYCSKEYDAKTARSRFCSDKCKLSYHRNNSSVSNDTQTPKNDTVNDTETKLTKTDKLFQDDAIHRGLGEDWLAFSKILRQPTCYKCGNKFKTRLPLLSYCSPYCRSEAMKYE